MTGASAVSAWVSSHRAMLGWLSAASLVICLLSLASIPILLARLPSDYFSPARPRSTALSGAHPFVVAAVLIGKNAAGALLVLAGIAMLVLPGQGILSILAGMMLLDVPGKRRVERAIVMHPRVRRAIDALRARAGRPPLEL